MTEIVIEPVVAEITLTVDQPELTLAPETTELIIETVVSQVTIAPSPVELTIEPVTPEMTITPTVASMTITPASPSPAFVGSITLVRHTAQALSGHRVVTPRADGWLVYADKTDPLDIGRPFWLTTNAWDDDVDAAVTAFGLIVESSWNWITGQPVFLSTDGLLTQTAPAGEDPDSPAFLVVLGRAASPTELFFDPAPPIALTSA